MISWFCKNGVAANLLMISIIGLGLISFHGRVPLEVFPDFALDSVTVRVPFRGATPGEVEEGVIIRIEEAIQDLEGIKKITSTAKENIGTVSVEVERGYDDRELLDDIKTRVDAINTFPDLTEQPVYTIASRRREVITVAVAGDLPEGEIRKVGERVRDDLTALPEVTQVVLRAVRPYEIGIEVSEAALDEYGMTFSQVANAVRSSSLDLSAGRIRTDGGDIMVRTKGQAYQGDEFRQIVVLTREDGSRVTVGDVAEVNDGFEEEPRFAVFNERPCAMVDVYRVGNQSAIEVAEAVKAYVARTGPTLPPGMEMKYWKDRSKIVKARLATLTRSALQGGLLVFCLLALFLRLSIARWVCLGIPVSFMGAFIFMPMLGVTINIVSLFAFILVLGIVVDDAIVTGENIYRHMKMGSDGETAAIEGTKEVAVPVTFGILTTVVAFLPIAMIGGTRGKIFAHIPYIVIPVLLFSLIESKLVLPSHLKHMKGIGEESDSLFHRLQRQIADGLEYVIEALYRPVLQVALQWRYLTIALFAGVSFLMIAQVPAGKMRFIFFPRVQSERATCVLTMPAGTPIEVTRKHVDRIRHEATALRGKYIDPETGESIIKDVFSVAGNDGRNKGTNLGNILFEIVPPEHRSLKVTSSDLVKEWRTNIGPITGVRELSFRAEIGRSGDPIDVQLGGQDFDQLEAVAAKVRVKLAEYPGVFDITDTLQESRQELQLKIKPEAEQLGLTMRDLARQVRQAFFGEEAQRIQRGRDDVRVMVRYPLRDRRSIGDLENMRIRLANGVEVPFTEVADVTIGRSFSAIQRIDRNRTISVRADVDKKNADLSGIKTDLVVWLDGVMAEHPGVRYVMAGEAEEQREAMGSVALGGLVVLFALYALLAIPFRSYTQPLIVMSVIPFGVAAAILGHVIMRMDLSILSIFGILALTGVVVNDSLVLVDFINRHRDEAGGVLEAVRDAGVKRFRPILLTSLTTFAGLTPLIFEKSTQAQFLIPMAVSLGFGILFTTFITLLVVPANYLILEDICDIYRDDPVDEEDVAVVEDAGEPALSG
jgi:multidrug efflux pump subunit AcrB